MSNPFVDFDNGGDIIQETCESLKDETLSTSLNHPNKTNPLLRISFKDEMTYRKYHSRIRDMIKSVLASEPKETQCEHNANIILDVVGSNHEFSHENDETQAEVPERNDDNTMKHKRRLSDENLVPKDQKKLKSGSDLLWNFSSESGIGEAKDSIVGNNETKESLQIHKDNSHESCSELEILSIALESKYVEFDKYVYSHREKSLSISKNGLTFFIPALTKNQPLQKLFVGIEQIKMVWSDLSMKNPTLYLHLSSKVLVDNPEVSILPVFNDFYCKALIPVRIVFSKLEPESLNILDKVLTREGIIQMRQKYPEQFDVVRAFSTPPRLIEKCVSNSEISIRYGQRRSNPDDDNNSQEMDLTKLLMALPFCTVRVGNFEVTKPGDLYIMKDAVRFWMPPAKSPSRVLVRLRPEEIMQVFYNFSGDTPALFIAVNPKNGKSVRIVLGMNDSVVTYFEPRSNKETKNKITFILQSRPPVDRFIKEFSKIADLKELTNEEASQALKDTFAQEEEETVLLKSKKIQAGNYSSDEEYSITVTRKSFIFNIVERTSHFPLNIKFEIPFNIINRILFCLSAKKNALLLYVTPSNAQKIESLFRDYRNTYVVFGNPDEEASHYLQRISFNFEALSVGHTTLLFERIMRSIGALKIDKKLTNYLIDHQIDFAVDELTQTRLTSATTVIIGRYKFFEQEMTYDNTGFHVKILVDRKKNLTVPITLKFSDMLEIRECFDTGISILVMYCGHSRFEELKSLGVDYNDDHLFDLKNEMYENRRIIILFHNLITKESAELRELLILSRFTKEQDFSLNKQMLWKLVPHTYIRDVDG